MADRSVRRDGKAHLICGVCGSEGPAYESVTEARQDVARVDWSRCYVNGSEQFRCADCRTPPGPPRQRLVSPAVSGVAASLRHARRNLGLSQADVAEAVGVGVPHISKVERGTENGSPRLLAAMAVVVGLDPDETLIESGHIPDWLRDWLERDPRALSVARESYRDFTSPKGGTDGR